MVKYACDMQHKNWNKYINNYNTQGGLKHAEKLGIMDQLAQYMHIYVPLDQT